MNDPLVIAPILIPLFAGALLLLAGPGMRRQRAIAGAAVAALLAVVLLLFADAAGGAVASYRLGDWPAPYGIVLVLDRLSALMLLLTAVLAIAALAYACAGGDAQGRHFHALFQFQLVGLNGAFLTGDLFNLFVFFELLLLASYALLLHGGGAARTRGALVYVVLNLAGSSLFLLGVALIYAALGTLNLADLTRVLSGAEAGAHGLVRAGALLLLLVFALKAAVLPLHFWLPRAYGRAAAPVAALFVIMTKVGVYAILRLFGMVLAEPGGAAGPVAGPWLFPAALLTLFAGALGLLASRGLREAVAYLVIVSVGTLLVGVVGFSEAGMAAALYYLVHTTLLTAGLFLLADLIAGQRGGDALQPGPAVRQSRLLGIAYLLGAMAIAGMPPLSGFAAKVLILSAVTAPAVAPWAWGAILLSSLLVIIALSRVGTLLFWHHSAGRRGGRAGALTLIPTLSLLAAGPLLVLFGESVSGYTQTAARQLIAPLDYMQAVLGPARESAP